MGVNDTLVFWGNSFGELDPMFVHVWTINDKEEMRFLIETYDVDGIMTDYPSRLTKVINELGVGD